MQKRINKEEFSYRLKNSGHKFCFLIILFLTGVLSGKKIYGQNSDTSRSGLRYPLENKYDHPYSSTRSTSPMLLPPTNVEQKVVYDPKTNSYVISEKIGELDYIPPSELSFEEYNQHHTQTYKSNYWQEKSQEEAGTGPSFLKNLRLGNQTIDKVFGGEGIKITPQGSAELIFGYSITNNKNPSIPVTNQRNGTFIFKEKIMMNVTGSIGDKMEIGLNYNTEATFDFENKTKLEYSGKEDEIIKKIEAGDVSFSVPGTLITGSQSLFGIKTELQFGRLTVSTIFSHQRSESSSINVQGGAQKTEFEVDIDKYDVNRHFFLSHFFRDNYDKWLENLPHIESQMQIEEIEVWVTNKQSDFTESRDIVAVMDIGEGYGPEGKLNFQGVGAITADGNYNQPASNSLNNLYSKLAGNSTIRDLSTVDLAFAAVSSSGYIFSRGSEDFISRGSARPLSSREYTLNRELGYISLNSPLRNDEILAVSFSYTYKGKTYYVGELSRSIDPEETLIVKMLKGTTQTPKYMNWDLMMKNVYSLGAYQVSSDGFVLDVLYRNDKTGVATNYITEDTTSLSPKVNQETFLTILEMDNLDSRNEPYPDGLFDFVEGVTILSRNGRIIFPVVEPFGSHLRDAITNSTTDNKKWNKIADNYVFQELYDSTQTKAQQIAEKNKFVLRGFYQSSSGSDIQLNAMNIPRGSVIVMAGGRELEENVDYTVDYTLGRVKIINPGIAESGTPIQVKLESNSLFSMQTKTLMGTHLDYKFSENFNLGGTVLRLSERPMTNKVSIGDEPIANTIWGLNSSYRTESQLLTSLLDKIPLIETKETSSLAFDAEFAQLIPGQSKMISEGANDNRQGSVAYIDDFEGAQTKIELKTFSAWTLCSPPEDPANFRSSEAIGLECGYNRAKLSWYIVDPLFYGNSSYKPDNVDAEQHEVRQIKQKELFPNRDDENAGFESRLSVLNLNFYPSERGPYNYNPESIINDGQLLNPANNWGGIMREIISSDFEASNIEFIEFWMMDPFVENEENQGGNLYFHLGEVSEDILRDNEKSFENGLPTSSEVVNVDTSIWGRIPLGKSLVTGFSGGNEERAYQDVGLDGLGDEDERSFFSAFAGFDDPSNDNFEYYLSDDHDAQQHSIKERYKNYNGMENNSPNASQNTGEIVPSNKTIPDVEDINGDNTVNKSEAYFQYQVSLKENDLQIGQNYIIDKIEGKENSDGVPVTWYQFRIPIDDYKSIYGGIEDFKSIRFMRILMDGFEQPVVVRFASLDLVRGEWRRYKNEIYQSSPTTTEQLDNTSFEVSSVNIEENGSKEPINYILPPGITRMVDPNQPQVKELNEQSLLVKVIDLEDNDGRAVFKNTQLDLRQYKNLKMFIHAEELLGMQDELKDYELTAFIRIGSDYKSNYYEYEVPLKITEPLNTTTSLDAKSVWPDENIVSFDLQKFIDLKIERNKEMELNDFVTTQTIYVKEDVKYNDPEGGQTNLIKVIGNPNLSNIRQIMLGIRNPGDDAPIQNDGESKSVEVWFNELRLTDFNNKGGWAANGQFQAKLADLGIVNFAGATSKPGFGSIEQTVEQRQKEEINQIDVSTNLELGKFFPEKAKVTIPLYMGYSNTTINPEYYPKDPDIKLEDALSMAKSEEERQNIKKNSQDITERKSVNITNVRWNKQFEKAKIFSPSNLSATATFSETNMHNYSVDYNTLRKYSASLNYVYNSRSKPVTPFNKVKFLRKPSLRIIRDFNFNYKPSAFTFSTKFDRDYQSMKLRNVYDAVDMIIKPTTSKGLYWDRNYTLRWDLTKSLKFDYSASNRAIIEEPKDYSDLFEPDNQQWKDSVWAGIMTGGRNMQFNQKFGLDYTLPINKIPIFNWTNLKASYDGTYNWTRGPVLADPSRQLGHSLKNSNTIKLNGNFNMKNLYTKVKYLKKIDSKYSGKKKSSDDKRYKTVEYTKRTFFNKEKPKSIIHRLGTDDVTVKIIDNSGREIEPVFTVESDNKVVIETDEDLTGATVVVVGKIEKGENPFVFLGENSLRFLMGIKNINLTYSRTASTMLPGYMPTTNLLGFNMEDYYGAPGTPFILGWQDENILYTARENNWLTQDETFSNPTLFAVNETFNYRTTFEPFKGFRIDITGMRTHNESTEQNYYPFLGDSIGNKYRGGSFAISVITIGTAFEKINIDDNWKSESFDKLKANREIIAQRLNSLKHNDNTTYYPGITHNTEANYSDGYGSTSPEVLMYSFLSAYTGQNPKNTKLEMFPYTMMPNWKVSFDGLSKLKFMQKFFKSVTIAHSYKSTYNVNSYGTNINYYQDNTFLDPFATEDVRGLLRDMQSNFVALFQPNSVSINEQLSPLISFNMTWHNSLLTKVEFRKTRLVSLSFNNNQLTESRNNDIVFGAGYKFKDVPLKITTGGGAKTITSDLNVRLDVSIRDNITILRSLYETTLDQATTGSRKLSIDFTADYVLSQRLNIQFYVRRDVNTPYVSNYYPNSETQFGFSLRMSL